MVYEAGLSEMWRGIELGQFAVLGHIKSCIFTLVWIGICFHGETTVGIS
jgi:hypothetical protein